jgi:hypothetical protein
LSDLFSHACHFAPFASSGQRNLLCIGNLKLLDAILALQIEQLIFFFKN